MNPLLLSRTCRFVDGRQALASATSEQAIGTDAKDHSQAGRALFFPHTNYSAAYKRFPDANSWRFFCQKYVGWEVGIPRWLLAAVAAHCEAFRIASRRFLSGSRAGPTRVRCAGTACL